MYNECILQYKSDLIPGTGSNSVLRQVTVPMIDQATCASRDYYGRYMDTTTMICAGYEQGGKDSCQVSIFIYSVRAIHSEYITEGFRRSNCYIYLYHK